MEQAFQMCHCLVLFVVLIAEFVMACVEFVVLIAEFVMACVEVVINASEFGQSGAMGFEFLFGMHEVGPHVSKAVIRLVVELERLKDFRTHKFHIALMQEPTRIIERIHIVHFGDFDKTTNLERFG
ncbi:MAG: hypothetical protein LC104_12930 [Bacteroidales bacterium]|nr:hypothetical protein [Bacteroidales bacterium]